MRIENRLVSTKDKLKKERPAEKSGASFLDALQGMDSSTEVSIDPSSVSSDDLKNLAGLIEQIGDQLSNNPTPENFNRYKNHIRLFIHVLQENFEVKDTISRISFAKQKLYKTVESIDENLSVLAQQILSGEKNRMNHLKLINNIKGLIIDLMM